MRPRPPDVHASGIGHDARHAAVTAWHPWDWLGKGSARVRHLAPTPAMRLRQHGIGPSGWEKAACACRCRWSRYM